MTTDTDISLLIPACRRPDALLACVESCLRLSADSRSIEVLVLLDSEDRLVLDIEPKLSALGRVHCMAQKKLRGWQNYRRYVDLLAALADGDFLFVLNDDCVMKTSKWDAMLKSGCASPKNEPLLLTASSKCGAAGGNMWPVYTRALYEVTGSVWPNAVGDNYIAQLAGLAEIRVATGIELEHTPTSTWATDNGAQENVRFLVREWKHYCGEEGCRRFARDKERLSSALRRPLPVWLPNLNAPWNPLNE